MCVGGGGGGRGGGGEGGSKNKIFASFVDFYNAVIVSLVVTLCSAITIHKCISEHIIAPQNTLFYTSSGIL